MGLNGWEAAKDQGLCELRVWHFKGFGVCEVVGGCEAVRIWELAEVHFMAETPAKPSICRPQTSSGEQAACSIGRMLRGVSSYPAD